MLPIATHIDSLDRLFLETEAYLGQLLGRDVAFAPLSAGPLPFFVSDKYDLREARLFGRHLIVLGVLGEAMDSPATVAKHVALVRSLLPDAVVAILSDALSSHNRHRILRQGLNFIVPGNQLFIPELGADLREHFRAVARTAPESLTPAAQVLVLSRLLGEVLDGHNAKSLAQRFHYSPMSTGRAIDELKLLDIIDVVARGRERVIAFKHDGGDLWRQVRPMLQTPVRATRLVRGLPPTLAAPLAGESALSDYTDLGLPHRQTRALSARRWKALVDQFDLEVADAHDPDTVAVQTWSYDPRLLCLHGPLVDRLSLYLSLEDRRDERLDQAADQLLEPFRWS